MAQQSTRSATPEGQQHGLLHRLLAWSGTFSIALAVMLGVLGGVGAFTFGYGQGARYLSNNPQAASTAM